MTGAQSRAIPVFLLLAVVLLVFGAAARDMPGNPGSGLKAASRGYIVTTTVPGDHLIVITTAATGTLTLSSVPSGASVFIDGRSQGITPLTQVPLSAGDHAVVLKMAGYYDYSGTVTITGGGQVQETWNLVPVTTPPTTAARRLVATTTTTSSGFADLFSDSREITTAATTASSVSTRTVANTSDLVLASGVADGNISLRAGGNVSVATSQVRIRKGATSMEALVALQMAVGKIPYAPSYDLNNDGAVTSADALEILRLSVQGTQGG